MIRYCFFDLDGTLTDPYLGITNSILYALGQMGREPVARESLRRFIGPPLIPSFRDGIGMSEEEAREAVRIYREYYGRGGLFENSVYPGIPEALAELQKAGCRVCLATSKPELYAGRILEHFGLAGYFHEIGGASMDERRAEKADVIRWLLGKLTKKDGLSEERIVSSAVMIGDRRFDAEGAAACGIPTVGVLWGYGSREELTAARCVRLVRYPCELIDAVVRL